MPVIGILATASPDATANRLRAFREGLTVAGYVEGQNVKIEYDGRRQPSCGGTSRMTRECQVRICERLGVKFPGPTRPQRRIERVLSGSAYWG